MSENKEIDINSRQRRRRRQQNQASLQVGGQFQNTQHVSRPFVARPVATVSNGNSIAVATTISTISCHVQFENQEDAQSTWDTFSSVFPCRLIGDGRTFEINFEAATGFADGIAAWLCAKFPRASRRDVRLAA